MRRLLAAVCAAALVVLTTQVAIPAQASPAVIPAQATKAPTTPAVIPAQAAKAQASPAVIPAQATKAPTTPGSVIASSPLSKPLWSKLRPQAAAATRVEYWSTQRVGGVNRKVRVTGAVFIPAGKKPAKGWPVLSWTHGTVGIHDSCAPSRNPRSDRDAAYLKHWLAQGYAVVSTDYAGLGASGVHPYLDGRSAAFNAIDMVRAARASTTGLARKWAVIGQSQGGHAALFATNLAAEYAPELDFRGGVATGPPSNLELLLSAGNPLLPDLGFPDLTTYFAYILSGLRTARPDFDVDAYLSDFGKKLVADGERLCYAEMIERVQGVPLGKLLRKPLTDPAFFRALHSVVGVPVSGYDKPFFIGQGAFDLAVFAPLTAKLTTELVANGQPVTLRVYPSDHGGTMAASLPDSTPYLATLFAG